MKTNLNFVLQTLKQIDDNPEACEAFLNKTEKMEMIFGVIRHSVLQYESYLLTGGKDNLEKRVKDIYDFLSEHYYDKTWHLHDVHFHPSFGHYVNCTFTTASEICECVDKILKENFCT